MSFISVNCFSLSTPMQSGLEFSIVPVPQCLLNSQLLSHSMTVTATKKWIEKDYIFHCQDFKEHGKELDHLTKHI